MQKALLRARHSVLSVITGKGTTMVLALFFAFFVSLLTVISIYARDAHAATSSTINFQARVLQASGAVVADGTYSVQFKLYDGGTAGGPAGPGAANAGTNEWTETQTVTTKNGYITASLGSVTPFPGTIDWSQEQWLTMNINGDGEMLQAGGTRMKITAVSYAFRSSQADSLTNGTGTITAANLAQLAPATVQNISSANAALRINQTGAGDLLQLQTLGADVFRVTNSGAATMAGNLTVQGGAATIGTATQSGSLALQDGAGGSTTLTASATGLQVTSSGNITIGALDATGTLLVLDGSTSATDPIGTNGAMYYNAVLGKFRCYENGNWKDCINGSNTNSTASLVSGLANVPANASGTAVESLVFTTATAVSNLAGVTGFTAPAAGSFRTCLVKNNAAITAGTLSVRWRVNGVSVGAAACGMDNTTAHNRQSASVLDPGVVTFNAGDTIGIAFDTSATYAPTTDDYTVYWSIEYYSSAVGGGGAGTQTLQDTYNNSGPAAITLDGIRGALTVLDNATPLGTNLFQVQNNAGTSTYLAVSAGGVTTNALTVTTGGANITGGATIAGGIDNSSGGIINTGNISGVGSLLTATGGLTIQTGSNNNLTLDAGTGAVVLASPTIKRTAAGSTSIMLNDTANTTLVIANSDATAVANVSVEGLVTAQGFSGDGSALTNLSATNITTGTLSDSQLSSNVALLNIDQSYTAHPSFTKGIIIGNTAQTTAGMIRYTGADFEGYNGTAWVSLTGGGGGSSALAVALIQAYDNAGGTDLNTATPTAMPWNTETKKDTGFTHSTVTNSSRVYLDAAGWYRVTYNISGANQIANANNVYCSIRLNGTTTITPSGSYSYSRDTTNRYTTNTATAYIQTTAANQYYEVLCSQAGAAGSQLAVAGSSWTIAEMTTAAAAASANFVQGGNSFGATAIIGTSDNNDFRLIANGSTVLSLLATGDATFANNLSINSGLNVLGATSLNGNVIIGNNPADTLTINASNVTIPNGLAFGTGLLAIDSTNNRVGINNATPGNTLSINAAGTADATAQVLIDTAAAGNKGLVIQTVASQSVNAFEVQNLSGQQLAAFGLNGQLILGNDKATPQAGTITFNDSVGTNGFTSVLGTSTLTAPQTINLPNESGTICIESSLNCGFVQFAAGSAQTDISANNSIFINKTNASGNIITLQNNGTTVFSVLNSGALQLQLGDNNAFTVKNTGGGQIFNIDTNAGVVQIGGSTPDGVGTLLVLDSYNGAGDPTGVNGGQYYNSSTNKFRCFQNNQWQDCLPAAASEFTITAAPVTWTNQPAAATEFTGTPRTYADLTNAREFRLVISRPAGTVTAGANCYVQYATSDAGPWTNLDGVGGPTLDISGTAGTKVTPWSTLDTGARSDVVLRAMCQGGNGVNDPQFRGIYVQVR